MINLKDKRTLAEALRTVKAYQAGRIKEFKPLGVKNLVTFLETALRVVDVLEKQVTNKDDESPELESF